MTTVIASAAEHAENDPVQLLPEASHQGERWAVAEYGLIPFPNDALVLDMPG